MKLSGRGWFGLDPVSDGGLGVGGRTAEGALNTLQGEE